MANVHKKVLKEIILTDDGDSLKSNSSSLISLFYHIFSQIISILVYILQEALQRIFSVQDQSKSH